MILVDTNILIDFFNLPTQKMCDVFLREEVATCGVVQAELLHGAKSDNQLAEIKKMFAGLKYIEMQRYDWQEIGLFLRNLKRYGFTVPLADAIIAYLAIKNNCKVWTNDKHFYFIANVIPNLHIFTV